MPVCSANAEEAIAQGKAEEAAFWKAVAEDLVSRGSQLAGSGIYLVELQRFNSQLEAQREEPDYVRCWYGILLRYAELFENDRGDLTAKAREEIQSILFRGMGSFSDFTLAPSVFGPEVAEVNKRLQILMAELYSLFTTV